MDLVGLNICSRYSYPPNSLSLCGPDKKKDMLYYSGIQKPDRGTNEILTQFSTLYPYLSLISRENNIRDPFDRKVVEAYWLGNRLLKKITIKKFAKHLGEDLQLKKKLTGIIMDSVYNKLEKDAFPNHSFHVLNIYKRTGNEHSLHTLQTMDACIINWGKVLRITDKIIEIETRPVSAAKNKLSFGAKIKRSIIPQGDRDIIFNKVNIGDYVSYHWGYFCQIISPLQLQNLIYYTNLSIKLANMTL
jgi:hypothetical protein